MKTNRINIYWLTLVTAYTPAHLFILSQQWGERAISDTGIFSILTIIIASIALLRLLLTTHQISKLNIKIPLYALAYIILIYILREADFHRLFTDEHITRDKFYTDPNIDIKQKLLGGIPLGIFFVCFFYMLIRYAKLITTKLLQLQPWAIAAFLWGATIFLSQVADKSALNNIYYGRVIEEMLEFCAAGYLLIAVFLSTTTLINFDRSRL